MNRLKNIFASGCAGLLLLAGRGHGETVFWSDNFETNAGSRWTTNSVWQIGLPAYGPAGTHTGFNCAATGLKTTAPANVDARLICTNYNGTNWLLVPAASQFPRLRFWQWFDFVNAEGYVEILQAGSTNWQSISATNLSFAGTANNSSGVWSRPSIDLSAFAGQNVQFAFHFTSGANYGGDPGWYLDDVAVVTNAPTLNDPESFEAGLGDWSVDSGTWEVGKPASGPNAAHGGTNCAATVLAGNYGWNVDTRLISPPFLVPTSGNAALRFWQWYSFVNALGFVEINNGTNTFTITTNSISITNNITITNYVTITNGFNITTNSILSTNSTITVTNSVTVTANSSWQTISQTNISFGSGAVTSGGWKTNNAAISLSAYAGQTVRVAFHFQSGGGGYGNAPGWYVDDVAVVAAPVLTVPANAVSVYAGAVLTVTNSATLYPAGPATFTLLSGLTNNAALNPTNGVLTWNPPTAQPPGNYTVVIAVTDTNGFSATNNFVATVLPPPAAPQISPAGAAFSPATGFQFSFQTLSNTTWRIDATTNLLNWLPVFTNTAGINGTFLFTDLPASFPQRFYRAVFP